MAEQWDNREEPRQLVGRCPSRRYLSRVGQWRLLRLTRRTRPQTARPLPSARAPRRGVLADAGFARLGCATRCHRVHDLPATRWQRVAGAGDNARGYTNWLEWPLGAILGHLCTLLGCCAVVDRRGDAIVYTNRRKWPISAVLGHLCTLLRLARIVRATVGTQECTQMGGSGLSAPLWGVCVHCCDTSRNTNRDASCVRWHECLNHHGVPAAPPRWPLSLGREDRLCASGAAARLASSPRRQPARTPEEHKKWANALWRWPANVSGGPAGVRTLDLGIKSPLLYQLSYRSPCTQMGWVEGLEPSTYGATVRRSAN